MDPELERLIRALDAVLEARSKADYLEARAIYSSLLDEVILRRPAITKQNLDRAITIAYHRWLAAQRRPPTLPPVA
jgi:hypothetical protein